MSAERGSGDAPAFLIVRPGTMILDFEGLPPRLCLSLRAVAGALNQEA